MIKIIGRDIIIPKGGDVIGQLGDHRVETIQFAVPRYYKDIDMTEFDFKLDTAFATGKDIVDLDKSVGDEIILTWTVEESHLLSAGYVQIQIRAFRGDAEKWVSKQAIMRVGASISPVAAYPDPLPSEFAQMEQRVTEAKDIAVAAETVVVAKAAEALASQQAASASEENAATSEANAADSKRDAGLAAEQSLYYAGQAGTYAGQAEEHKNAAYAHAGAAQNWADEAQRYSQSAHAAMETIENMTTPIMAAKQAALEAKDIAVAAAAEATGAIESLINCGESQPTRGLWLEVI